VVNINQIFPRVLIVSAAPLSTSSATGITLQNLFADWPKDRLAQIYDDASEPDPSICGSFRRFSSGDMPVVRIAKGALQRFRSVRSNTVEVAKTPEVLMPSGSVSYGLLSACGDIAPFSLPEPIREWVASYRPDVIYSVLGSVRMMNVVLKLNEQFATPIVAHFMDDWPSTAYSRSWRLALPRAILDAKLRSILKKSPYRMTICEDMATEFSRRYGGEFEYFMNCVEVPESISPGIECDKELTRFGFVGGLHLNRWRSLLSVATALDELKGQGMSITLDIYAPQKDLKTYGALFENFSVIGEMATLKASEVNEKLLDFDVPVHVESFLEEDSYYTRLSVSTKIPQYMASGRPILAFGPPSLSSVRYVERTGAGLVVDVENDISALKRVAGQLAGSSQLRRSLGGKGFSVATAFHSAQRERGRFRDVLSSASARSS
jgi:hypothetical protein